MDSGISSESRRLVDRKDLIDNHGYRELMCLVDGVCAGGEC